jgi:hypothetical protein
MALIDQLCLDDEKFVERGIPSEAGARGFQRKHLVRSVGPYIRHQAMLGQLFEFEVAYLDSYSNEQVHSIKVNSRRYKAAGLIIRAMMFVPAMLAGLTGVSLALTWYFLVHDAVVWGVAASGASIVFGSLFVVGIKLLIELRGATHGFKSISFGN